MKEATGELNMTVVTLVAISAVGALLYLVIWPMVQRILVDNTCKTYGDNWSAFKIAQNGVAANNGDATVSKYECCRVDAQGQKTTECFSAQ